MIKSTDSSNVQWTFLTNHTHVLVSIAQQPDSTMRDIAQKVGITERAVQRIVSELQSAGYLSIVKEGRRNIYSLDLENPLRHPVEKDTNVRTLLSPFID